jgi:hypothetical protein
MFSINLGPPEGQMKEITVKQAAIKKRGWKRPIDIDFELVNKLCSILCTGEEIAHIIGVDYDTLNGAIKRNFKMAFPEYFGLHSAGAKASLRRMQWRTAEEGNPTMQIWLGKQYLGQKDKSDLSSEDGSMRPTRIEIVAPNSQD